MEIKHILLNNSWQKEARKYFKLSETKNVTLKFVKAARAELRGKFQALKLIN